MKTVILSEEIAPRHYSLTMYAGDVQRIEYVLSSAPSIVTWSAQGGEIQTTGINGRKVHAVFRLNDDGGDGVLQAKTDYADGTSRKIIIDISAMNAL